MKNLLLLLLAVFAFSFNACQKEAPIPDPCANVTCLNGGTCINGSCDCPPNYSGVECQLHTPPDPCANVTCFNGGTCINGSCDCPTGWTGSNCQTQVAPTIMIIDTIVVTNFPNTHPNGTVWDNVIGNSTWPDVLVSLNYGTTYNQNEYISEEIDNATGALNLWYYGTGSNLPLNVTSLSSNLVVGLWDDDGPGAALDEPMAGVSFRPIDKAAGFPSVITVTSSEMQVQFAVRWRI